MNDETPRNVADLLTAFEGYRECRLGLLSEIGIEVSNRDPLSEFAEVLVARLLDGSLADNRVQKGWDVLLRDETRVQVKYVANPSDGGWVNWHTIFRDEGWDAYALVVYLNLAPKVVYVFQNTDFGDLCTALGKRHEDQATTLQFTKTCHQALSANPDAFERYGVKVYPLSVDRVPTVADLQAVAAFTDIFESDGFIAGEWVSGETADDGVVTLGFWSASGAVHDWHEAIYKNNVHLVFDWMTQEWREVMRGFESDPSTLASADLETIRKVLTTISRADRFNEGYMGDCFDSGLAQAATRRLAELSQAE